eukprot:TRINITY_DN782031_c0_g1_i1.p1 TRINITY_DN782031_c0_g1~~TRINITY_DN782031_c0_g1_i1.p1  ORF type:complete len:348 (+),score=77.80 TRINITY_DN782031_c0_g1_i1:31-1044(+)
MFCKSLKNPLLVVFLALASVDFVLLVVDILVWKSWIISFFSLWCGIVYLVICYFYQFAPEKSVYLLNKDTTNGKIFLPSLIFLLPYFIIIWSFWWLRHTISNEDPYNMIIENLIVGRFPKKYPSEFPEEKVGIIVDLTGEMYARSCVKEGRQYFCLPSFDMQMPEPEEFFRVAKIVTDYQDDLVYIHCANGHGRSSSFCAVVMVMRGFCDTIDEAFEMIKKHRPAVGIRQPQKDMLDIVEEEYIKPYLAISPRPVSVESLITGSSVLSPSTTNSENEEIPLEEENLSLLSDTPNSNCEMEEIGIEMTTIDNKSEKEENIQDTSEEGSEEPLATDREI